MRVASTVILRLSIELEADGHPWSHPWDHYPFIDGDRCLWVAWQELDQEHREQVLRTLRTIEHKPGALAASPGLA